MSFDASKSLEREVNKLLKCYPDKRSASLMVLHAIQEEFGYISKDAELWAAEKLDLRPINIHELVTFYPMLREHDPGKTVVRVCRTLSCALAGSHKLHGHICEKLGLNKEGNGLQRTKDGKFGIEYAECLASCGTGPVMMCNDDFYEGVSNEEAEEILRKNVESEVFNEPMNEHEIKIKEIEEKIRKRKEEQEAKRKKTQSGIDAILNL